jgi:hypothetical protein
MRSKVILELLDNCWSYDEPLTSEILVNMAKYLRRNGYLKEFNNFYNNRKQLICNYKITQLGYTNPNISRGLKELSEDGIWL